MSLGSVIRQAGQAVTTQAEIIHPENEEELLFTYLRLPGYYSLCPRAVLLKLHHANESPEILLKYRF